MRRLVRVLLRWTLPVLFMLALPVGIAAGPNQKTVSRERLKVCRAWLRNMKQFMAKGADDSALVALDSVLACDSANADAFYYRGIILSRRGDTAGAVAALETGVTRAPLSARLKVRLARLYQALGKWQESITLVKEVLQVKRHHAEAAYVAGLGMLHLGDSTAAADYFEQALTNITTEH